MSEISERTSRPSGLSVRHQLWPTLAWALPALAALVAYGFTLGHGFIADDTLILLGNRQYSGNGSLLELLTSDWFSRSNDGSIGYYRPVAKLSLFASIPLFGTSAAAFHAGNLLLHALAATALAWVAAYLFDKRLAIIAGCVFAVHPATAQAVSIITARPDLLAGLFLFAGTASFLQWRETRRSRWWLTIALVASLLAFGSKESALLLPLVLLAATVASTKEPLKQAVRAVAPFLALALAFAVLRWALGAKPLPNELASLSVFERLAAMVKAVGAYLPALLLGRPIVALPHLPTSALDPTLLIGLFAVLGCFSVLFTTRCRSPLAFAIALGALGIGPALAVWLTHMQMWRTAIPIAERWLYLPSAALALAIACGFQRLRPPVALSLAVPLVVILGSTAVIRAAVYENPAAYADHAAEVYREIGEENLHPNERYLMLYHEGISLMRRGETTAAISRLKSAISLYPWLAEAWEVLALYESERGALSEAEKAALVLLSNEFWESPEGRQQRTEHQSDAQVRLNYSALHAIVGRALAKRGNWPEALGRFELAIEIGQGKPGIAQFHLDRGVALEALGRSDDARAAYLAAKEAEADWYGPELRLAMLDQKQGKPEEAVRRVREVIARGGQGRDAAEQLLRQLEQRTK